MHIKSIVAGAAIALAATIGSASAADQFTTLVGVEAQAMSSHMMGEVRGMTISYAIVVDLKGRDDLIQWIGDSVDTGFLIVTGAFADINGGTIPIAILTISLNGD